MRIAGALIMLMHGVCQSGDECILGNIEFSRPFPSDHYVCTGNELLYRGGEQYDAELEFYPQTGRYVSVQFPNDSDDDIPNGFSVRISYRCESV